MPRPQQTVILLTFSVLTLIWGTTWAVIRIGLRGMPPFTGVALRFALASVILLVAARMAGVRLGRNPREPWLWLINGGLTFTGSYGIVYWCEQWVPSGLAAVIFATFPLFVSILAHFALPGERLTRRSAIGILVGFAGAVVIYSDDLAALGGPGVAVASVVMLGSPIVASISSVAIKRWGAGIHPLSITAVPMGLCAVIMGVVAALTERGRPVIWNAATTGALLYLAVFGSAVTFSLYYWLLAHVRATRLSLIGYTVPVVAVFIGVTLLDEPLSGRILFGSAVVLAGVALAVHRPAAGPPEP